MLLAGTYRDQSTWRRSLRRRTGSEKRTGTAIRAREANLDTLVPSTVKSRSPATAGMPLRTDGTFVLPINMKLAHVNPILGIGLPSDIWTPGPNHINPLLPT